MRISTVRWLGVVAAVLVTPVLLALLGPQPQRDVWTEVSVGLGFVALSFFIVQILSTMRTPRLTTRIGYDAALRFHRAAALVALTLVIAHPVILFVTDPRDRVLLNPASVPLRAWFGYAALAGLLVLVGLSLGRARLRIRYELWKTTHALLATGILGASLVHVLRVGYYTDAPAQRAFWMVVVLGAMAICTYQRFLRPRRLRRTPYRVAQVRAERGEAWTLELRADGHDGRRFRPGQFAWLIFPGDGPLSAQEHPFSFASSARAAAQPAFTVKELGNYTMAVKDVPSGTTVYLDGPHGAFCPDREDSTGFVFIGGGIGVTPIMCMLRTFADRGDRGSHLLLYANRTWEDVVFREELVELRQRLDLRVVHVLSHPHDEWDGPRGHLDAELLAEHLPPDHQSRQFFVSGPPGLITAAEQALKEVGVPSNRVHLESFSIV